MLKQAGLGLASILIMAASLPASSHADTYKRHKDRVLGTSFDLVVNAPGEAAADQAEAAMLEEIERLNAIFSGYDATSEISRLNQTDSMQVSEDLMGVLQQCEAYRKETGNAFSCRIGSLVETWSAAEDSNALPKRPTMRVAAGELRRADVALDADALTVTKPEALKFNTDAIAKGHILDAALAAGREAAPDASGLLLNIGGDVLAWGAGPHDGQWSVAVTSASELGDGASSPAGTLKIDEGAVATSGLGPRDLEIDGEAYGHVISPTDGWPVSEVLSASVHAPEATDADALATTLLVMGLKRGLSFIEDRAGIEAEIVTADGRHHATSGWSALQAETGEAEQETANWPEGFAFSVDFEIPEKDVSDYERPYVAVWIADDSRNLIRILMLAGDESRWMEENYYWYRRFGRKAGSLVDAVAGPTRRPGEYELSWDGLTDDGEPVPPGDYILHIEAAREHGGHQHESIDFTLSDEAFSDETAPGEELGEVALRFGAAQ
ncbi:DUF2271 domain-containing protein [Henriciella aquimarina]|uniref:DUF2271 domain-containing protein n=1 Tax=Henriciella aquimarina TaxID=545261 RepID=UPI001301A182|nr:DUF2271 domain-containing protein [Henriciella aquimarina]